MIRSTRAVSLVGDAQSRFDRGLVATLLYALEHEWRRHQHAFPVEQVAVDRRTQRGDGIGDLRVRRIGSQ